MQSLIALVCDGVGYGVLPEPEVRHLLRTKELIEIAPEWAMPFTPCMQLPQQETA